MTTVTSSSASPSSRTRNVSTAVSTVPSVTYTSGRADNFSSQAGGTAPGGGGNRGCSSWTGVPAGGDPVWKLGGAMST